MGIPVTLTGAMIRIYINNKPYNNVQSVTFTVDYGEHTIYGIDVPNAQEIAPGRLSVSGSVQGLRLKLSGGLQGDNIRPLFYDLMASPYISLRIQDRSTGEDIVFLPQTKVTQESHSLVAKSTYKLSFNFTSIVPQFALDRA